MPDPNATAAAAHPHAPEPLRPLAAALRGEWPLAVTILTAALFALFGDGWPRDPSEPVGFAIVLGSLFGIVLLSAFSIVRHAEGLAALLGEPLGTLVLTLAVISIEVMMISASMATGGGNPTLARDTMFAVVMIVLNGLVGLSLVLGGLRHHEQTYNLQGANAYLALILPLAVLGLVLPSYTTASEGATFSTLQAVFLAVMSIGLYGVFLAIQNVRHKDYFAAPEEARESGPGTLADAAHGHAEARSVGYHAPFLLAYLLPLVFLSKELSYPLDAGLDAAGAPAALGGLIVAALVLSPESMTAVRAAVNNDLQRSVNLLLGSVLATISLTIPAVLAVGLWTGQAVVLGLGPVETTLLVLSLVSSTLTFASAKTNVLLGAVHLLLFLAYLMLIFEA